MNRYAAPAYINKHLGDFDNLPPGHRFGLFFPSWNKEWGLDETGKKEGLIETLKVSHETQIMINALRLRQYEQAQTQPENAFLQRGARSDAPFITGIGMEHPLENGFAFLNPYGVPYLPGSGVKGVLRRAAEDLAMNDPDSGWSFPAIWWLFGFEASSTYLTGVGEKALKEECREVQEQYLERIPAMTIDAALADFISTQLNGEEKQKYSDNLEAFLHDLTTIKTLRDKLALCGALCFWDVYPNCKGMAMDILTPHQGEYYKGNSPPNDCGQPIPNCFLVLPPGSDFPFYVTCSHQGLPVSLKHGWKNLLSKAFEHAFDWFGFGAKTAVGYGQMSENENIFSRLQEQLVDEQKKSSPWISTFEELTSSGGWGELEVKIIQPYKNDKRAKSDFDFLQKVHLWATELRRRGQKKDKWDEDRDSVLAQWFADTGLTWGGISEEVEGNDIEVPPEEQEQISYIESIADWGQYQQKKPELDVLSLAALQVLQKKLQSWGCNQKGRRANTNKKAAYDEVHKLIKQKK